MEEKLISPAEIYRKFLSGDPFSEEEISLGLKHFGTLARMLRESGAAFSITAAECNRVMELLNQYVWERHNYD
jgi:hypothetical protein